MIKVSNIKNNSNNPRTIDDDNLEKLKRSIKSFPEMMEKRQMVCVTDVDGKLYPLGGNMRLRAIKDLGMKEIPKSWVSMADEWTEEQRREFIIKDNASLGDWNLDDLQENWDLELISEWGVDLDIDEIEELEAEEDDFDVELPEEPKTVLGDLYEIGEHRLLCGDSTCSDTVEKLMGGEKSELLFTSPPYSDMRDYNGEKDLDVDNIVKFILSFYPYCEYQAINLGLQRKNHDINQYWDAYIDTAKNIGYKFLSWNVWAKTSAGSIGNQSAFFPISHEWIFVFGKDFKEINLTIERKTKIDKDRTHRKVRQADGSMKISTVGFQGEKKQMESVFYSNPELGVIRSLHPATFPIELPSEYIKAMTNQGDIITEPFLGSGTTMAASHQLKRKCYGMELDPKYCDVIINRMVNLDPDLKIKRNGVDITNEWN